MLLIFNFTEYSYDTYKTIFLYANIFLLFLISFTQLTVADDYSINGPYTHKNLSIYLIHGEDRIKNQNHLTLNEAMLQKKVIVHETSNVNMLSIENKSVSHYIYIQAGDIVKGGKQDRVFSTDMVLQPGSGKVNISSFCVEQGRWNKRGNESAKEFHSSTKKLSSKKLRLAARLNNDQSEVWAEVSKAQNKLEKNIGANVKSSYSVSSLQLTLENKNLKNKLSDYKEMFLPLVKDKNNVIGYAFAVNGVLNSADIYANKTLLKKLWPKIIDAAATESVSEYKKELSFSNPTSLATYEWMKKLQQGKKTSRVIKPGLIQDTIENETEVRFDTYSYKNNDKAKGKILYRQNFIKK